MERNLEKIATKRGKTPETISDSLACYYGKEYYCVTIYANLLFTYY